MSKPAIPLFIDASASPFPIEPVAVAEIPDYGGSLLDEDTIRSADLARPILLAEIAPRHFSVIDGNHRTSRAPRDNVATLPGRRIRCPAHVAFLTSTEAYAKYVEYWNSTVAALQRELAPRVAAAKRTRVHAGGGAVLTSRRSDG